RWTISFGRRMDPGAWAHPLRIATFSARLPHRSGAQPSGLAAGERPIDDEHDERATDGEQPGLDLKKSPKPVSSATEPIHPPRKAPITPTTRLPSHPPG